MMVGYLYSDKILSSLRVVPWVLKATERVLYHEKSNFSP